MYNSSCVCSVSLQARALCPQTASRDRHRFLVGTCSLHDSNELSVLQYSEDSNHLEVCNVYAHPDQVCAIEASPKDASLVITSRQAQNCSKGITLWKMPHQSLDDIDADVGANYANDQLELTEIASFNQTSKPSTVRSIRWHYRDDDTLLTVDNKILSTWTIGSGKISQANALLLDDEDNNVNYNEEGAVAWDPHSSKQCGVVFKRSFQVIDTREMTVVTQRRNAHDENIRAIDFNPNKPLTLITASDDRKIKIWDLRNLSTPIKTLVGHSHWVRAAQYNPFHDQLIVSGGSDNVVNLWRVASCSSAPWIGSDDNSSDPPDVKVRAVDHHEDSVYGVTWSAADAWVYCSLSYDGRAMINHVPSTEKYKILL